MKRYTVTSFTYPALSISARSPDVAARKYARSFSTRTNPLTVETEGDESYTMREPDGTERDTCFVRESSR